MLPNINNYVYVDEQMNNIFHTLSIILSLMHTLLFYQVFYEKTFLKVPSYGTQQYFAILFIYVHVQTQDVS